MADNSKIEWTDMTWNVVNGCSLASPGCTNCYAMKQAHRFAPRRGLTEKTKGGMVWTGEVRFNDNVLLQPIAMKRARRIFVCAHGDLFHEKVPDEWIDKVFAVMALSPQHQFQVLTKRAERMSTYFAGPWQERVAVAIGKLSPSLANGIEAALYLATHDCLPNVWLGVSVEDQKRADERIPHLLTTPAAVRWLSCEPLLGPVDLTRVPAAGAFVDSLRGARPAFQPIGWVVTGGESGPHARPMHPDWARSLRDQCAAAGVPFLFKQWGAWKGLTNPGGGFWPTNSTHCLRLTVEGERKDDGYPMQMVGKKMAGRELDGVEHNGFPA